MFGLFCIAGETCSERIQDAKSNMSVYADVLAEIAEKLILEPLLPFICESAATFKLFCELLFKIGNAVLQTMFNVV